MPNRLLHPSGHETWPLRFAGRQTFLLERTSPRPWFSRITRHETRITAFFRVLRPSGGEKCRLTSRTPEAKLRAARPAPWMIPSPCCVDAASGLTHNRCIVRGYSLSRSFKLGGSVHRPQGLQTLAGKGLSIGVCRHRAPRHLLSPLETVEMTGVFGMKKVMVLMVAALFAASALYAQLGTQGSILGVVTDTTGAVVPGVTIVITNIETGQEIQTQSNEVGIFEVFALNRGFYSVQASLDGFKTWNLETNGTDGSPAASRVSRAGGGRSGRADHGRGHRRRVDPDRTERRAGHRGNEADRRPAHQRSQSRAPGQPGAGHALHPQNRIRARQRGCRA